MTDAITASQLSVRYATSDERIRSFKEYILQRLRRAVRFREIVALDNVSFEVEHGEIFGVIGANGAGKSSLLKVISRVISPSSGRIIVRGRVAPLLELGAGFHPDLTGRENIFLNGTLLGYPKQALREQFERIVAFAELQDFVDVPLRNYSSGMSARLGFSVATIFRPDILLLDEILAVGDEAFQARCLERILEFKEQGTTILFVSHALDQVDNLCDRSLWLESGRLRAIGPATQVIHQYQAAVES